MRGPLGRPAPVRRRDAGPGRGIADGAVIPKVPGIDTVDATRQSTQARAPTIDFSPGSFAPNTEKTVVIDNVNIRVSDGHRPQRSKANLENRTEQTIIAKDLL